jgi:hypothetical protein
MVCREMNTHGKVVQIRHTSRLSNFIAGGIWGDIPSLCECYKSRMPYAAYSSALSPAQHVNDQVAGWPVVQVAECHVIDVDGRAG